MKRAPHIFGGDEFFVEPGFPLLVHRRREPATVPLHAHSFTEIVIIAAGTAVHEIETALTSERRAPVRLIPGDAFVIAPGERHIYRQGRKFEIYNVLFDPALLKGDIWQLRRLPAIRHFLFLEPMFRHERGFPYKLHLPPDKLLAAEELLDAIIEEQRARRLAWEAMALARLTELLVLLGRAFHDMLSATPRTAALPGRHHAIERAIAYIEQNYARDMSLSDIACRAFLSPNYFSAMFRDKTGLSPWTYLTQVRVERARQMLRETPRSVTEIGLAVGFSDSSHFARVFRAAMRQSPSAYRRAVTKSR